MREIPGRSTPPSRRVRRGRTGGARSTAGRIGGLFLLLAIVALPVLSTGPEFVIWETVPVDGFAASTGWRYVGGTTTPGTIKMDLTAIVGHSAGGNQYQFHESTDVTFTRTITLVNSVPISETTPVITIYGNVPPGAGGCCAAPHASCNGDGSCTTAFRGSDGRFRELTVENGVGSSMIIDPAASDQLSATAERWGGGVVVSTSDTIAVTTEIYIKPDGSSTYTQVAQHPCDSPLTNLHWGTAADPLGSWLITGCRNGGNVTLRQITLPGGGIDWQQVVGTVPAPNQFRYIQVDFCGDGVTFPDQSTGPAVAYAVPRNSDTLVGITGPVGGPGAPPFNVSKMVSGTHSDYFGFDCENDKVTLIRNHPVATGTQFLNFDFDELSGDTNLRSTLDASIDPVWINTAPDWAGTVTPEGFGPQPAIVDTPYLPIIIKDGSLEGGLMTYGSVPRILFFDGFESGDTRFWDQTQGLAFEGPSSAPGAVAQGPAASPR